MISGHGDDRYLYNREIKADFSSNTWYGGPAPGLLTCLQEKIAAIDHYPDPSAEDLQRVIASNYGLETDQVLVTNGATEAIYLVAQAFCNQTSTILVPAFAEYEDACRIHGLDIQFMFWDELTAETKFATSLVFICNPNNPTGAILPVTILEQLMQRHPDCCFVIDEAYIEFTTATTSVLSVVTQYENGVLLRSLTKTCCIPGLRLGYIVAGSAFLQSLRQLKMPWSVNRLAIEAGYYIYGNKQQVALPLEQLLVETTTLQRLLHAVTGWKIRPSDTHYFLVETKNNITAAALKQWLVQEHGILIRDASNFRGLTPYHFRIACQQPEHNQLLIEALGQCSHTGI